jgi:hypothetical protein
MLGYVGKKADGTYAPFHWNSSLPLQDVEISDDVFIIRRELAEAYKAGRTPTKKGGAAEPSVDGKPGEFEGSGPGGEITAPADPVTDVPPPRGISGLVWNGEIPHQKWMNFYTKVLSKFAANSGLRLTLRVEVAPPDGVSSQKLDDTKVALRELGLKDSFESEGS